MQSFFPFNYFCFCVCSVLSVKSFSILFRPFFCFFSLLRSILRHNRGNCNSYSSFTAKRGGRRYNSKDVCCKSYSTSNTYQTTVCKQTNLSRIRRRRGVHQLVKNKKETEGELTKGRRELTKGTNLSRITRQGKESWRDTWRSLVGGACCCCDVCRSPWQAISPRGHLQPSSFEQKRALWRGRKRVTSSSLLSCQGRRGDFLRTSRSLGRLASITTTVSDYG